MERKIACVKVISKADPKNPRLFEITDEDCENASKMEQVIENIIDASIFDVSINEKDEPYFPSLQIFTGKALLEKEAIQLIDDSLNPWNFLNGVFQCEWNNPSQKLELKSFLGKVINSVRAYQLGQESLSY